MQKLDMEKLNMALMYVDRIADGKDPINNIPAKDDATMNNPDIIRCMFFIKEALTILKNNNGVIDRTSAVKKKDFPIESLTSFVYDEKKTITRLTEQLNSVVNEAEYKKLSYKTITDWLKINGYLQEKKDDQLGKKVTVSTEKGQAIGITHSLQTSMSGVTYYRIEYDRSGQEFIIQMLPEMLANAKKGLLGTESVAHSEP